MRDFHAQYRQSVLGYLWVIIPPLFAALPFVFLNASGVANMGDTPIPYAAYAMIGTTIWQAFVDSLNAPLKSVLAAKQMLARVNLPREAILMSALLQVGFACLVRLTLLAGVLVFFRIAPAPTAFLFPLGIGALIMAGFIIGLFLTPLGLLYTDVQHALPITTTFLMLLTPVVYPPPVAGVAAAIAGLNPLTPLVSATRDWLVLGNSPHWPALALIGAASVISLICGWVIFRIAMPHIIARLGT
jgi:lipopolysaccharide transport system permease protein